MGQFYKTMEFTSQWIRFDQAESLGHHVLVGTVREKYKSGKYTNHIWRITSESSVSTKAIWRILRK